MHQKCLGESRVLLRQFPVMQDVFTYLDIIVYVEATIYQMDEDNEKLCGQGGQEDKHILTGKACTLISTSNLQL